jgi:two-component system NarL family sensor kinase
MIGQRLTEGADASSLSGSLGAASEILASTISSSERISRDLRPSIIDTLGLAVAVRWHAREVASRNGMALVLGSIEDVTPDAGVSIVVFRVFQGILAHLESQCEAVEVRVRLERAGERMRLEVSAIGEGELSECGQLHSLDLIEIRELTLLYGGTVSIENTPGGGTTVSVEAPCRAPFSHANGASSE